MVSILLRVIMGKGSGQNMFPDHTYSNHFRITQSPADGVVFNLRPAGCPVLTGVTKRIPSADATSPPPHICASCKGPTFA